MRLLYTNPFEYQFAKAEPETSLGPYPSAVEVPTNLLHSLFGDIYSGQATEVRALVLRNTSGADITSDITIYTTNNSASKSARYSMAIEALSTPDASKECQILSSITNPNDCPSSLVFYYNEGVDNAITIPASVATPFAQNAYYAIWIKREVNDNLLDVGKTCDELLAEFNTAEVPQVATVTFPVNTAGALNNQYWFLDTLQSQYYVWYNSSGAGANPSVAGRIGIKVNITDGDTADTVASLTQAAISATIPATEATFAVATSVVTITNVLTGPSDITNETMVGAVVAITTTGTDYSTEKIEDIDILISW